MEREIEVREKVQMLPCEGVGIYISSYTNPDLAESMGHLVWYEKTWAELVWLSLSDLPSRQACAQKSSCYSTPKIQCPTGLLRTREISDSVGFEWKWELEVKSKPSMYHLLILPSAQPTIAQEHVLWPAAKGGEQGFEFKL